MTFCRPSCTNRSCGILELGARCCRSRTRSPFEGVLMQTRTSSVVFLAMYSLALSSCSASSGSIAAPSTPFSGTSGATVENPTSSPATASPSPSPSPSPLFSPALTPCIPPGAAPAFTLISPAPGSTGVAKSGSVLVSTFTNNPQFSAVLNFVPAQGATVIGSSLVAPSPAPSAASGMTDYSASYTGLIGMTQYDLRLAVTQYTDLPQNCQKHFTVDLGTVETTP